MYRTWRLCQLLKVTAAYEKVNKKVTMGISYAPNTSEVPSKVGARQGYFRER